MNKNIIKNALQLASAYIDNGDPLPEDLNDPYFAVSDAIYEALKEIDKEENGVNNGR